METNKNNSNRKKTDYKLDKQNLDLKADLEYIDLLLKDLGVEVAPGVRGVVLDIAYTLARDKLVEAMRFAKISNRTNVTVKDLQMVHLEETDELKNCRYTLKNIDLAQETLPKPCMEKGLMLPNWRNCQVGVMAELKDPETKTTVKGLPARTVIRRIPKAQIMQTVPALINPVKATNYIIGPTSMGILPTKPLPLIVKSEIVNKINTSPPTAKKPRQN